MRTPATSQPMENILNRFLQYDSGIPTRNHNVRCEFLCFSSISRVLRHYTYPFFVAQSQQCI